MDTGSWRRTFGVPDCPMVDFGLSDVPRQAQMMAGRSSISGVQPKLLVKFDKKKAALVLDDDGEYILKPQTPNFPNVPENEQCCMDIADELGIDVPAHCLVPLKDKSLAYVVKRFDRRGGQKVHQEDFFQVLEKREKYDGSVEQIGKKLREISSVPGLDVQLFYERVVLSFLVGNGDAHFKNYAILHLDDGQIRLAPAYDLVCSRLVIRDDESALTINGKKNRLERADFDALAEHYKVPDRVRYEKFERKLESMKRLIGLSRLDPEKQEQFIEIIRERLSRLRLAE